MKRVLSIDGGGIRGLIPALILAELESATHQPISKLFDLVVGTSTGGLLALGVSMPEHGNQPKHTASDLVNIYLNHGRTIFKRSFWKGVSSVAGLTDEIYSAEGLESVLEQYFGNTTMAQALTRCMVTTYNIQARTPLFIKSWQPKHSEIAMTEAGRATSAAPTYFEPAQITIQGVSHPLVDGGVFINSPAVSAYAEAKLLFPNETIQVLSLGTGELTRPIPLREAKDWGKAEWLAPLLSCIFDGVADASDYQMTQLLGPQYRRMQIKLENASDDMDNASQSNLNSLRDEAQRLMDSTDMNALVKWLTT